MTQTPSTTPSTTASQTPSTTPSQTPSQTPSTTASNTPSTTASQTPSQTPSTTPSNTPSTTASQTPSQTPSTTPSQTPSVTSTSTPSQTMTPTTTPSQTITPTVTPSATATTSPHFVLNAIQVDSAQYAVEAVHPAPAQVTVGVRCHTYAFDVRLQGLDGSAPSWLSLGGVTYGDLRGLEVDEVQLDIATAHLARGNYSAVVTVSTNDTRVSGALETYSNSTLVLLRVTGPQLAVVAPVERGEVNMVSAKGSVGDSAVPLLLVNSGEVADSAVTFAFSEANPVGGGGAVLGPGQLLRIVNTTLDEVPSSVSVPPGEQVTVLVQGPVQSLPSAVNAYNLTVSVTSATPPGAARSTFVIFFRSTGAFLCQADAALELEPARRAVLPLQLYTMDSPNALAMDITAAPVAGGGVEWLSRGGHQEVLPPRAAPVPLWMSAVYVPGSSLTAPQLPGLGAAAVDNVPVSNTGSVTLRVEGLLGADDDTVAQIQDAQAFNVTGVPVFGALDLVQSRAWAPSSVVSANSEPAVCLALVDSAGAASALNLQDVATSVLFAAGALGAGPGAAGIDVATTTWQPVPWRRSSSPADLQQCGPAATHVLLADAPATGVLRVGVAVAGTGASSRAGPVPGGGPGEVLIVVQGASCGGRGTVVTGDGLRCQCSPGYEPVGVESRPGGGVTVATCVPCPPGTVGPGGVATCNPCADGEYSYPARTACQRCPGDGVICEDGLLYVRRGFYPDPTVDLRAVESDSVFHPCLNRASCVQVSALVASGEVYAGDVNGSASAAPVGLCEAGYRGPLCAVCAAGYAGSGVQCFKCWSPAANVLVTLLILTLVALFVANNVSSRPFGKQAAKVARQLRQQDALEGKPGGRWSDADAWRHDPRVLERMKTLKGGKAVTLVVIRVGLNAAQVLTSIAAFNLPRPSVVTGLFSVTSSAEGLNLSLFPVQCASGMNFYERFWTTMALPPLAILGPMLVSALVYVIRERGCMSGERSAKDRGLVAAIRRTLMRRNTPAVASANPLVTARAGVPSEEGPVRRASGAPASEENPDTSQRQLAKARSSPRSTSGTPLRTSRPAVVQGPSLDPEQSRARRGSAAGTLDTDSISAYMNRSVGVSTSLLFILYPGIMRQVLVAFNTHGEDVAGETYLAGDFAVPTSDPRYRAVYAAAVVAVGAYLIGIPAAALYLLWRRRHSLADPAMRDTYAMLYAGYRLKGRVYLWEGVVLARKVAFAFLSVFVNNGYLQAHIGVVMLLVALMLHLTVRPFSYAVANGLETASLSVSLIALYGLLYLTSQQEFDSMLSSVQTAGTARDFSSAAESTTDQFPVNVWLEESPAALGAGADSGLWSRYLPAVDAGAAYDLAGNATGPGLVPGAGVNATEVFRVGDVTLLRQSVGGANSSFPPAPQSLLAEDSGADADAAVNVNASAREVAVVVIMMISVIVLVLAFVGAVVQYALPSAGKKAVKLAKRSGALDKAVSVRAKARMSFASSNPLSGRGGKRSSTLSSVRGAGGVASNKRRPSYLLGADNAGRGAAADDVVIMSTAADAKAGVVPVADLPELSAVAQMDMEANMTSHSALRALFAPTRGRLKAGAQRGTTRGRRKEGAPARQRSGSGVAGIGLEYRSSRSASSGRAVFARAQARSGARKK